MDKFTTLTSIITPLNKDNVDTDQIIPAQYLTSIKREGFAKHLFEAWRKDPNFILNQSEFNDSQILMAGENFGCGSSREHAPWAILEYGFKVVIAKSFADIFKNNSSKIGLLLIELSKADLNKINLIIQNNSDREFSINIENSVIKGGDLIITFSMDSFRRKCFMEGVDDLGYLLSRLSMIKKYEKEKALPPIDF